MTNKYVIATLLFVALIFFLDEYNLMVTNRVRKEVEALHEEEAELKRVIEADSVHNASLRNNLDAIEHYGRENYYMKRSDEDIFVIK